MDLGGDFGGCCPFLAILGTILSPPLGRRWAVYKGGPRARCARPRTSPETAQIRPKTASSCSILYKKAPKMALFPTESSNNGFIAYEKLLKLRYFIERAPKTALFHKSGS